MGSGSSCIKSVSDCDESGATDGSDGDQCCKIHDACCGSSDRRNCNAQLNKCLEDADHSITTKWCMNGDLPVATGVIYAGMKFAGDCCGSSCNEYELSLQANETLAQQAIV